MRHSSRAGYRSVSATLSGFAGRSGGKVAQKSGVGLHLISISSKLRSTNPFSPVSKTLDEMAGSAAPVYSMAMFWMSPMVCCGGEAGYWNCFGQFFTTLADAGLLQGSESTCAIVFG